MRITELRIENFRSIKRAEIRLGRTTVFVGPNNAGKTAILEALRIALTRKWGQRGTGFTEYDVHLPTDSADPKTSPGPVIEVRAEETVAGEWPDELHQALDQIIQSDPATGIGSITLRVSCSWNVSDGCFQPEWSFLNVARQALGGSSARRLNLDRFWQYVPMFYLGALRDSSDEFSSRSQFWGRLLKAMEIPGALESRVHRVLDILNRKLLAADPRLAQIASTLREATRVATRDREGGLDLRVLPLKSWDLLSKAEIILRNEPDWPWLPLQRQGQGLQSLSVIFLFRAFVEQLLADLYADASEPVLALEEPETHLHPQAARALWAHIRELPGQKIVTTHSPYFVQHIPFRDLRVVRLTHSGTEIVSLPTEFVTRIPHIAGLDSVVAASRGKLRYDRSTESLTVAGILDEPVFRHLMACYGNHASRATIEADIRDLRNRSLLYVSDEDLTALDTYARRIRGEIFFAQRWMLVEGQSEYLLVHAMASQLGYDLDENGVSVIDAMNNGNPPIFASLARALGIPWLAVFDGDLAGQGYVEAIKARGFAETVVAQRCRTLSAGCLEEELLAAGLESDLRSALAAVGQPDAATISSSSLQERLKRGRVKIQVIAAIASSVSAGTMDVRRMPAAFRDAIFQLRGLT